MEPINLQLGAGETVQAPVDPTLSIEGMAADAKATGDALALKASAADLAETDERVAALENGSATEEELGAMGERVTALEENSATKTELEEAEARVLPKPEDPGSEGQVLKNAGDGVPVWGPVGADMVQVTPQKALPAVLDEKANAVDVIPKPETPGTEGQHLEIDAEGNPVWLNPGTPTDTQVGAAVDAWLVAHPEATTTVEDGTITRAKLDADLKAKTDAVPELQSAADHIEDELSDFIKKMASEKTATGTVFAVKSLPVNSQVEASVTPTTIKHFGKNVFGPPSYGEQTINGVTFTPLPDGTVHVSGTAEGGSAIYRLTAETDTSQRRPLKAGTYTLSGTPDDGGENIATLWIAGLGRGNMFEYGEGLTFDIQEDVTFYAKITVYNGVTIDTIFKPQIELGSRKTNYEPYVEETVTATQTETEVHMYDGVNTFWAGNAITVSYYEEVFESSINLKSMGAVGDGVTDDTTAIQAALDAAEGMTLYIPAGTYLFSRTLNIKSGTRIVGAGEKSKFLLADTFNLTPYPWRTGDPLIVNQYRYPMIYLDTDTSGCVLENFALQGQSAEFFDANCDGLCIRGTNHKVSNLVITKINYFPADFTPQRVNNGVGHGIKVQDGSCITIENCRVEECGYQCLGTENADTVLITGCVCKKACQTAGQVHRNSYHIRLIGNTFDNTNYRDGGSDTKGPGFTLHAAVDQPMSDVTLEGNYINSALVFANGGGENDVRIINNKMGGISLNAFDGWRNGCMVIGNHMMGQLNLKSDNAIIACNMIHHTGGGYIVVASGENIECLGNIPLNAGTSGISIKNHAGTAASFVNVQSKNISINGTPSGT